MTLRLRLLLRGHSPYRRQMYCTISSSRILQAMTSAPGTTLARSDWPEEADLRRGLEEVAADLTLSRNIILVR